MTTTASQHITSQELADKYGLRRDQLSRKLKPFREALEIGSITVKIEPEHGSAYYVVNPDYLQAIEAYLTDGTLPSPTQETVSESSGSIELQTSNGASIQLSNPFLNGISTNEGCSQLTTVGDRLEAMQTRKLQRSNTQINMQARIQSLAVTGFQQGVLDADEEKDALAEAYEQAAQEEIQRLQREQELEAVRRQARQDVQAAFSQAQTLGKSSQ